MRRFKLVDYYFGVDYKYFSLIDFGEKSLFSFEYWCGEITIGIFFMNFIIRKQTYEYMGH